MVEPDGVLKTCGWCVCWHLQYVIITGYNPQIFKSSTIIQIPKRPDTSTSRYLTTNLLDFLTKRQMIKMWGQVPAELTVSTGLPQSCYLSPNSSPFTHTSVPSLRTTPSSLNMMMTQLSLALSSGKTSQDTGPRLQIFLPVEKKQLYPQHKQDEEKKMSKNSFSPGLSLLWRYGWWTDRHTAGLIWWADPKQCNQGTFIRWLSR